MLDRDLRSLYRTGLFELIEFKQEVGGGHDVLNLVVEVTPKYRVLAVQVLRATSKVKSNRLEKEDQDQARISGLG